MLKTFRNRERGRKAGKSVLVKYQKGQIGVVGAEDCLALTDSRKRD